VLPSRVAAIRSVLDLVSMVLFLLLVMPGSTPYVQKVAVPRKAPRAKSHTTKSRCGRTRSCSCMRHGYSASDASRIIL
jgi:hypothetical protein